MYCSLSFEGRDHFAFKNNEWKSTVWFPYKPDFSAVILFLRGARKANSISSSIVLFWLEDIYNATFSIDLKGSWKGDFLNIMKTCKTKCKYNHGNSEDFAFEMFFPFWNTKYILCSLSGIIYLINLEEITILCECFAFLCGKTKTDCCIELSLYLFKQLPAVPHILEVNVWCGVLEWEHLLKFLGDEMSI